MKISTDPNYIKSSNLIFLSAGLGFINLLLSPDILSSGYAISVASFSILFVIALGLLVRFGIKWIKYVLLCLTILGFTAYSSIIEDFKTHPVNGAISALQSFIQIWALLLLFKKDK